MEFIILDDSDVIYNDLSLFTKDDRIRYFYTAKKMPLGKKRNKLNSLAKGDIIVCHDDDDGYSPFYVSDVVDKLINSNKMICSCNILYIYHDPNTITILKSTNQNNIRNATFACKKEYLINHKYTDSDLNSEEIGITNDFTTPVELLSAYSIIVYNHGHNTINYSTTYHQEKITLQKLILLSCKNDKTLALKGEKIFQRLIDANEKQIVNKDVIEIIRIKQYFKIILNNNISYFEKKNQNQNKLSLNIIATITTTPTRITLISNVLNSIIDQSFQFKKICLNVPNFEFKTNQSIILPPSIYALFPNISVLRCNDYGPITSIIPIIKNHNINEDIWITLFHDDIFYESNHVDTIVNSIHSFNYDKNTVYGFVGFDLDSENNMVYNSKECCVNVLEGYGSITYHRSVFKDDFISYLNTLLNNDNCKYSDDLIIANYLAKYRINRLQIYPDTFNKDTSIEKKYQLNYSNKSDALKNGKDNLCFLKNDRYKRVIQILKEKNMYYL
jgi:hypothetical protein